MAAVLKDARLSDTARLVLIHCAVKAVLAGDDTLDANAARIAAEMHLDIVAVAEALGSGRELGWLELCREGWRAQPRRCR
jgi:hypothetical protein